MKRQILFRKWNTKNDLTQKVFIFMTQNQFFCKIRNFDICKNTLNTNMKLFAKIFSIVTLYVFNMYLF